MSRLDRRIAGLTCLEVLGDLSAFLDGELSEARVAELRGHLSECHECDQFGATVAGVLTRLRAGSVAPLPPDVRERMRTRLADELNGPR
jgi:anti-sigma factor RsiW